MIRPARSPQMYWKASHKCWYMKEPGNNKKEIRLHPDEEQAAKLMHKFLGGAIDLKPGMKVADLICAFLDSCKESTTGGTYDFYRGHCLSFADSLPARLTVDQTMGFHLQNWIEKRYPRRWMRKGREPSGSDEARKAAHGSPPRPTRRGTARCGPSNGPSTGAWRWG